MTDQPEKFGTLLGIAPGNVPVYSSHYDSADSSELPDRDSYRSYVDGIFMGYKWQCVEFARRWLYINKGYVFDEIAMAYDIFDLQHVRSMKDNAPLPLCSFRNGSRRRPEPGSLLIWNEGGEFVHTGHVAVITEVHPGFVRIVEQNADFIRWDIRQSWSRELPMRCDEEGRYWISCTYPQASVLGWVMQTADATHAEPHVEIDPRLFDLTLRQLPQASTATGGWLDPREPDEAAYIEANGGEYFTASEEDRQTFVCMSESVEREIRRASNELHAMFMHVTNQVVQNDSLLEQFNLPKSVWPRLRASWNNRKNAMITGRFDFSVSSRGIKVYEYNADSASCYLEAGKLQGKWFEHHGYDEGWCPGENLHDDLRRAWRKTGIRSPLHIMQDNEKEETYHALYMKSAAEEAGLRCKVIVGLEGLGRDSEGFVIDADGERIRHVWKTWAWETAINQLRDECEEDEALERISLKHKPQGKPRLVDVLLSEDVMVYEPLWTLIPSNKAILPLLWANFPDNRYLLESGFRLNDELEASGYVVKPIAGRCGFNISMVDKEGSAVNATTGQFSHQELVYQQLFRLPQLGKYHVQLCSFTVDGKYSAACVRVDSSQVITTHSDLLPLRVLEDKEMS